MRNSAGWGMAILVIALVAGIAAFWAARSHRSGGPHEAMLDGLPELEWVRSEFRLSDEQFAKVSELHRAYRPKCVEMCDRIRRSHIELEEETRGADTMTPELRDAIDRHARVHAECQQAMIEHLFETARILDEGQASLYLEAMFPYTLDFSQSETDAVHEH